LRREFLIAIVVIPVLALFTGLWTYRALATFFFGCVGFVLLAYVLYMAAWAVLQAYQRRTIRPLEGTFWPFLNEKATMEAYGLRPYASRAEYAAALARPPYLCGGAAWR